MTQLPFLPYGRQRVDEDDIAAVAAVLRSAWLTTGPETDRFEADLGAFLGARHVISCSSGTAALHLSAMALKLGPGDAAIVPSITFVATANAVALCGAEVVFCDVDPETGLAQPHHIEDAMARARGQVRAIFPVHLNGQATDLPGLTALLRDRDIAIVDDAAHALGGNYEADGTRHLVGGGSHSTMTCLSLHPVKSITSGEGGAVTTNDAELAERLKMLRVCGITRNPKHYTALQSEEPPPPWYYEQHMLSTNYRMTDIHAALGRSQLRKLAAFVASRNETAFLYLQKLQALAPTVQPVATAPQNYSARHLMAVRIDFAACGTTRAEVVAHLHAQGIGTQVHYMPVHRQPVFRKFGAIDLPGADRYSNSILSLPLFVGMTDSDVSRVVAALAAATNQPKSI
jgi:UDP-4-amino-4,6-dideoxy-N-acetyl-beta-L-altrosamine transaminase